MSDELPDDSPEARLAEIWRRLFEEHERNQATQTEREPSESEIRA